MRDIENIKNETRHEIPQWLQDEVAAYDLEMSPPPATVLDIGANIGAFALRCHERWPEAGIRCFEPAQENYRGLANNVSGCSKIKAYRFAIRSFNGWDHIFIGDCGVTCGFHQLGRQTHITQKVMCADAREIAVAELVKVDTEGCEVEIISRLDLSKTRALVVEYHSLEDAAALKTIAVTAGFELLESTVNSPQSGVLKFGRAGSRVKILPHPGPLPLGEGVPCQGDQRLVTSSSTGIKERKIYVGVAAHFSNHDIVFVQSMMGLILQPVCRMAFGWSCDPSVERARNVLTANFLASDCTHLLFIDADIAFSADDVRRIISHDEDIVGGIYPLKTVTPEVQWCGNGLAPEATAAPAAIDSDVKPISVRPDGLQEVGCIGTGFMCIARRTFDAMMASDGEKIRYVQDWPPHREEFAFWRQTIRSVSGRRRFLTEDWNFCYRYRELGGKVFADTRVVLRHAGRAVWPLELQTGNPFAGSPRGPIAPAGAAHQGKIQN